MFRELFTKLNVLKLFHRKVLTVRVTTVLKAKAMAEQEVKKLKPSIFTISYHF